MSNRAICRFCQAPALEMSHRRGFKDHVLACFKLRPARCKKCHQRSYVRTVHLRRTSHPLYAHACRGRGRGMARRA